MSKRRANQFLQVCNEVGPVLAVIDPREGWPGTARLNGPGQPREVALHVSTVSPHSRKPHEFRFQNPAGGELVASPNGALPILVGCADHAGKLILVVTDGKSRLGLETRFPVLFDISIVQQAAMTGWAEYRSSSGETIVAMHPRLLPAFIEALTANVAIDPLTVGDLAAAAGLLEERDEETAERTRAILSRLVRRAAFGRDVCNAYDQRCSLCGIGMNLPEGAHIYPANAPGSSDAIWNGVALCRNHHRTFDLCRIWINPDDKQVVWHPEIIESARVEPIVANFVNNTRSSLAMPRAAAHRPRSEMFVRRYEAAGTLYDWAR